MELKIIARIYTDFPEKFGIPRQSGLVKSRGKIVFEPEYRRSEALRGIDGYSHLWLLWEFSEAVRQEWSPTVRPPRLGGNKRVGVFATRSPYRPNPIGLSSVKLICAEKTESEGTVLYVSGADILNGTPIYDIKPYLAFTDSHPDALGGFSDGVLSYSLEVEYTKEALATVRECDLEALTEILSGDPRPAYKKDDPKEYGMCFGDYEVFFTVCENLLTVLRVIKKK